MRRSGALPRPPGKPRATRTSRSRRARRRARSRRTSPTSIGTRAATARRRAFAARPSGGGSTRPAGAQARSSAPGPTAMSASRCERSRRTPRRPPPRTPPITRLGYSGGQLRLAVLRAQWVWAGQVATRAGIHRIPTAVPFDRDCSDFSQEDFPAPPAAVSTCAVELGGVLDAISAAKALGGVSLGDAFVLFTCSLAATDLATPCRWTRDSCEEPASP
jgi:hypothetical protein